jgi:glutathione S-transferase
VRALRIDVLLAGQRIELGQRWRVLQGHVSAAVLTAYPLPSVLHRPRTRRCRAPWPRWQTWHTRCMKSHVGGTSCASELW